MRPPMQLQNFASKQTPGRDGRNAAPAHMHTLSGSLELMGAPMSFAKGVEIYGEGEPADYLYKVLSGTVRTYRVLSDGRRQIGAFHFPGDIFGLETGGMHLFSAEGTTNVNVIIVRRSSVIAAVARDNELASELWSFTAKELNQSRDHIMLLIKNAQERVAAFLLEMAERVTGNAVELPMSRQDIADYLGLTIETVSRTLTQLEDAATIELPSSRRIVLRNRRALVEMNA